MKWLARVALRQDPALWTSLLPGGDPESFGVRYTFDPEARDYDALVVYEDLPPATVDSKRADRVEPLACARANTLFVTTEPTSIKVYGRHYLRQFGHVLSRQPAGVIDHPGHIQQTPPLRWYYGRPFGPGHYMSVDELRAHHPEKTRHASTVCSAKRMAETLHAQRYDFTFALRERAPELLDVFGRGVRSIADKAEAMDAYRLHIAVENHIGPGHWTEKISDTFLAECLPLYYGPPDIGEVFPEDAVLPIDIFDVDAAEDVLRRAVADGLYTQRRPAVLEAKRRVLDDHNLLKVCAGIIRDRHDPDAPRGGAVMGRHAFRAHHPLLAARDALWARRHKGRW